MECVSSFGCRKRLRIKCKNRRLISSDQKKWRHVSRKRFNPCHIQRCWDNFAFWYWKGPEKTLKQVGKVFRWMHSLLNMKITYITTKSEHREVSWSNSRNLMYLLHLSFDVIKSVSVIRQPINLMVLNSVLINKAKKTSFTILIIAVSTSFAAKRCDDAFKESSSWILRFFIVIGNNFQIWIVYSELCKKLSHTKENTSILTVFCNNP